MKISSREDLCKRCIILIYGHNRFGIKLNMFLAYIVMEERRKEVREGVENQIEMSWTCHTEN